MIWIVAIALIALLAYYWYITIPMIVLIVIYWNRESLQKKIECNKVNSTLKDKKLTQTKASSIIGDDWKNIIFKNDVDYFNYICDVYENHESQLKSYSSKSLDKQKFQDILNILEISFNNLENNVLSKRSFSEESKIELKNKYNLMSKKIQYLIENLEEIKKQAYEQYLEEKRLEEQSEQEKKKQREEKCKLELLDKFDLTKSQAIILFKRNWYKKLSMPSCDLLYEIQDMIIDIQFGPKFRKRIYPFIDKVLRIIENVYAQQRQVCRELGYTFQDVFEWVINPLEQKTFWDEYARFKEKSVKYKKYFARYERENKDEDFQYEDYANEEQQKQWKQWEEKFYEQFFEESSSESLTISEAFKVLGLDESATAKQIKDRFRELILKHHPDRNSDLESEEIVKKIIASYNLIKSKVAHT